MTEIETPTWAQLQLVETRGADGILDLALVGELDLAVAAALSHRLDELGRGGTRARLDLSRLEFIDASGLRALTRAARRRCGSGEQLVEIGHEITPAVRHMIDLVGASPILWPTHHPRK